MDDGTPAQVVAWMTEQAFLAERMMKMVKETKSTAEKRVVRLEIDSTIIPRMRELASLLNPLNGPDVVNKMTFEQKIALKKADDRFKAALGASQLKVTRR